MPWRERVVLSQVHWSTGSRGWQEKVPAPYFKQPTVDDWSGKTEPLCLAKHMAVLMFLTLTQVLHYSTAYTCRQRKVHGSLSSFTPVQAIPDGFLKMFAGVGL